MTLLPTSQDQDCSSTSGDFCSTQPLADFYPYAILEGMGGNPAEPVAD